MGGQAGILQIEGESQRPVTIGGSDRAGTTDLWLSPAGSNVAPGLIVGKSSPSAAEWTLTTSASPYPCQAWDCLTFPNPEFFRVVLGANYRAEVRHLSCYIGNGCPIYKVVNGNTRFDGQNAEIVEATFGGPSPASASNTAGQSPRRSDWWISKASDEVLQLQSHGPGGGTTTVTYHWQRLTSSNCSELAVGVPRAYKFVPSTTRAAGMPFVVPKLSCSSLT